MNKLVCESEDYFLRQKKFLEDNPRASRLRYVRKVLTLRAFPMLPPNSSLIDFGFGHYKYLERLEKYFDVTGVDINPQIVEEALRKGRKAILHDLTKLISLPNKYTIAISCYVVEHIKLEHLSTFIDNMREASDINLIVYTSSDHELYDTDDTHVTAMTNKEWKKYLRHKYKGWGVLFSQSQISCFCTGVMKKKLDRLNNEVRNLIDDYWERDDPLGLLI